MLEPGAPQGRYEGRGWFRLSNGGGAGSDVWDSITPWGEGGVTTRANVFKNVWVRYAVNGATTPNWSGPTPAP